MEKNNKDQMKILDTTETLDARAKEQIATSLLNRYYGQHDRYPTAVEGVIIRPLGMDAYEADLVIKGQEIMTLKFSGRILLDRSVKLPNRDLTEKNIR